MRSLLAILAFALFCPAAAQSLTIGPGSPGDSHDAISRLQNEDHPSWLMEKKMRRMKRRATSRHELPPVEAERQPNAPVPEPSAGLVFAAGALIAASRLRRRR